MYSLGEEERREKRTKNILNENESGGYIGHHVCLNKYLCTLLLLNAQSYICMFITSNDLLKV